MTTKEYLAQIRRYDRRIESTLREINHLRATLNSTPLNDGDCVQTSAPKDKLGAYAANIVDMENSVKGMIIARAAIVSQISEIDNDDMYDVLTQFYVLGKDMKFIELRQGQSYRQIRRILYAALEQFEMRFGALYLEI